MAFTAKDVITRVSTILQDAGAVRWPLPEHRLWLNDAMREVALVKPNATSKTVELSMVEGTLQTIDVDAGQTQLMRVIRNLSSTGAQPADRVGSSVVTPIAREILDQQINGWHDNTILPFSKEVRHVIDDITETKDFYVVPGNDGTGVIEAIVCIIPTPIDDPVSVLDPNDPVFLADLDIEDIYMSALIDFVLYRAFSKDMNLVGSANRAQAHYNQFATALGVKLQGEAAANVNTTNSQPNS